ncbi:MAG: hypothetical protein ABI135_07060 [Rhodoferax sp.]
MNGKAFLKETSFDSQYLADFGCEGLSKAIRVPYDERQPIP